MKLTKYSRPGEIKIVCVDHNLLIGNSTEESNADENQRLQMSEMDVYNLSMRGQWSTCLSWKTLFYKRTFLAFDVTVINYVYFTNTVFLLVKEEKNVLQVYRAEQQKYQASKYSWTHSRGLPQNGQKSDVMSSGYAILPGSQQLQSLRRHQLIQSCRNRHQRSICSSSDWGACTAGLSLALSPWGRTGKGGHNQDQEQCFRMSLHQGILPLGVRDTRPSDLKAVHWSPTCILKSCQWFLVYWGLNVSSPSP